MLLLDGMTLAAGVRSAGRDLVLPGLLDRRARLLRRPGAEVGLPHLAEARILLPALDGRFLAELPETPIWDDHAEAVGHVGRGVVPDGGVVRVPLMLSDAVTQAAAMLGRCELRAAYRAVLDHAPGSGPDGVAYDAVARDLRPHHVVCARDVKAAAGTRTGGLIMSEQQIADALVQDAAGQLAKAVAGLPAAEAADVLQNAVTTAVLRAADRRIRAPHAPNGGGA
ncbi:MAG TPA: DUF2213 domain-containing protein [Falsiroseomonas sp.]|jgi:hypothetical protein|nr:DUF2213 domain-containing protein [Falsiroseomonas sp.]